MASRGARQLLAAARAEPGILLGVVRAIREWLDGNHDAVLKGGVHRPPDMSAWLGQRAWDALVNLHVAPKISEVWLARWEDSRARTDPDRWLADYLRDARNRLRNFRDDSWNVARLVLRDGVQRGESIPKLRDRVGRALRMDARSRATIDRLAAVAAILDDPDATPAQKERARQQRRELNAAKDSEDNLWHWRAERIARTETIGAFNSGTYAAAFQAGLGEGQRLGLQWWATRDARTRDTHRAAHGQTVPVGRRFHVGAAWLLYPGDPTGPPEEVINCRCVPLEVDL